VTHMIGRWKPRSKCNSQYCHWRNPCDSGQKRWLRYSTLPPIINKYYFFSLNTETSVSSTKDLLERHSGLFSVSGPTAWSSLPTAVHSDLSSSSCFCRHL